MPGASETASRPLPSDHGAPDQSSSGSDAAEKVEHSGRPRDQPPRPSTWESRMSDEVPFTAINLPVPPGLQGRIRTARELVFYGRVGGEASRPGVAQIPPEAVPRHEAAPGPHALLPEMAVRAKEHPSSWTASAFCRRWGGLTHRIERTTKTSPFMLFGEESDRLPRPR